MAAETSHFYNQLPPSDQFISLENIETFTPVPNDWWVVIADVKDSTQAVEQGRYKEVNMIGASCITAVLNVCKGVDIPFVFGGDGATILVPGQLAQTVQTALINTRGLVHKEFAIDLRIGKVAVTELRRLGKDVLVSKFELSEGNTVAMFSGGGVELADKLIKQDQSCEAYAIADHGNSGLPDLSGLSCRWQPLQSQHGKMVCLLIQVLDQYIDRRHKVFGQVLTELSQILGQDLKPPTPVTQNTLRFQWPMQGLKIEAKLTKDKLSFIRRYAFLLYQSFIQLILERFNLSAGGYNAPVYREEIRTNTDYRRFDDALRLVLDCSTQQIDQINEYLQAKHQTGEIAFGMHITNQAQMTCLVFSLEQSQHIHFVDGTEGGFWAAAKQYKKQLSEFSNN